MRRSFHENISTYGTDGYGNGIPSEPRPSLFARLRGPLIPRRFYVAVMAFFGFFCMYSLRVSLSVAILEMTNSTTYVDGSPVTTPGEFADWNSHDQGMILSAFFYGYILTQLPGGFLSHKIGGKIPFGGGILGSSLLALTIPISAYGGKSAIIFVRVLQGLCEGMAYPSIHAIWSFWAPPSEKTKLATIGFAGCYLGTVFAMPVSGSLAESLGWRSVFYFFGVMGVIWSALWFWTVAGSPSADQRISIDELQLIHTSIGFSSKDAKAAKTPWESIFTSLPVYSIVVAHFCENWGFYTMMTFLPRFLSDISNEALTKTGFLTAVPYLVMGLVVLFGGWLADYLRRTDRMTTGVVRKLFTSGAFMAQVLFIIGTAYSYSLGAAVAFISLAIGLGGFAWAGFSVNPLDLAPQYASVIMGVSNTVATIPGMISPNIVGAIVQHGRVSEWRLVFFIAASIYFAGGIFYALFASGKLQPWAEMTGGYSSRLNDVHNDSSDSDKNQPTTHPTEAFD